MSSIAQPGRLLIVAVAAALALAGCSRAKPEPPHAGLGAYPYDGGRADGTRRSPPSGGQLTGPPGSQQQFQSAGFDTVYFASDSVDLTPEAQRLLTDQAAWLRQYPSYAIVIEGHADERGTREYNIALGQRRAHAVKSFLTARGVNAATVRTVSFGKERPVATCNDISCWSKNRRAQTVLSSSAVSRR